jgi:ATP-dependent Clp protease ATP-binding subunit ClpC
VGPTGVGKTELARALAVALFDDENALLKFDMSEFMESHQVSRLISAPPGYVGYDKAGQLTEAVRKRPYCVVLFDEIEKAHPYVSDLLLQILEDGCLTDAHGQKVDFKHTFIILTSNIGTSHTRSGPMTFMAQGEGRASTSELYEHMRERIMVEMKNVFRPELFNRIDELVVFCSLNPKQLRVIVDLMIAQTRDRLSKMCVKLQVTEAALLYLITYGYNPDYGARPLRRAVQSQLDDLLAEEILRRHIVAGDSVIVDRQGDRLVAYAQPCVDKTLHVKAKRTGLSAA